VLENTSLLQRRAATPIEARRQSGWVNIIVVQIEVPFNSTSTVPVVSSLLLVETSLV